jgi:hypothetical protein
MAPGRRGLRNVEPVVRSHGSSVFLDVAPHNVGQRPRRVQPPGLREFPPRRPPPVGGQGRHQGVDERLRQHRHHPQRHRPDGRLRLPGGRLVHPNERIEKWWKEWFRRVRGKERSERFLNLLYRTGNVIVKRHTARLPVRRGRHAPRRRVARHRGAAAARVRGPSEIPWRYSFLNPLSVDVVAGELTAFVGQDDLTSTPSASPLPAHGRPQPDGPGGAAAGRQAARRRAGGRPRRQAHHRAGPGQGPRLLLQARRLGAVGLADGQRPSWATSSCSRR